MRSLPSTHGRWIRQGSSLFVLDLDGADRDGTPASPTQRWQRPQASGDVLEDQPSPHWEYESEARFSYNDVPPIVVALLDKNLVDRALEEAVRHGDTNVNHLTDLAFFKLYPDRQGRFIATSDPDFAAMSRTWDQLRDTMVKEALDRVRAFPTPTRAPCYQPPAAAAGVRRVWVFSTIPTDQRNLPGFVVARYQAGYTDIVFEINDKPKTKNVPIGSFVVPKARLDALRSMIPEFCHLGIDVHLMCWLQPQAAFMQAVAATMQPLCQTLPVRSLLFDLEEPWTTYTNADQTRALLASNWPFGGWPCSLGATSTSNLPQSVGVVAQRCNYVLPQAYSTNGLGQRAGQGQRTAVRNWGGLITPARPLVMGLAAWDLNLTPYADKGSAARPRPRALTEQQALQAAIVAAETLGAKEVAYWSLPKLKEAGAEKRAACIAGA
jgi:hypothetical protein